MKYKNIAFIILIYGFGSVSPLYGQDMEGMEDMHSMDMASMKKQVPHQDRKDALKKTYPRKIQQRYVHIAADAPSSFMAYQYVKPVMDEASWFHGILDEFEGRYHSGGKSSFRWDGEAWYGTDYNRLWLKSEGTLTKGKLGDGDQELLYSHAISSYFNLQTGVRLDLDDGPTRPWGAFGIQGLALYQFEVQATGYVSGRGAAARFEGSYDILLTNRLILQPQIELNLYTQADKRRGVGAGLSDIDAGLRLRYEIWRKFAPYIAFTYDGPLTQARKIARHQGENLGQARFSFGIRSWF